MDDDAGPQSLFVVVTWDSASPYYSSIIQLETQVHNHEYASSAIETEFSAHIPRLPQVQRAISWAFSLPPESSTEDLYVLLGCPLRKSETEKVGKLPGFIFNLSTKKCKIIKAPLAPKYMGHVVTMGDHIYFMAQPGKNSPDPRFERYDTLSQSWEEREPLPLLTDGRTGLIEGTAVLDDTILFNIDDHKMWAYNVGRDKWYPVTVKDNLCYNFVGVAVVLNKIIYAITEICESVVSMTLKSQEIEGDLVFTCDLHKEYVVPGMEQVKFDLWDAYEWTRHLVHLGKDNFCVVQSCNHFGVQNQYIQVTYIEVSDKKSIVTNICLHEFKIPRGGQFIIGQCFSMPKRKTTALKEGHRFLKLNPEHEAEIATLPPELASIIKIGDPRAVIEEKRGTGLTEGGSVSQTSQSRDDVDTTPEVQEDVPKKSSASSQSRDDADTKTRQVQEDVPKTSSPSVAKASTLGDSHSIFVTNLPPEGNYLQFFKGLKRFGPIKSLALHIDHNNTSESFAHVEFESATSKQNAIKASIIKIGDRRAVIAEKRGTSLTQGGSVSQTSRSRDDVDTTPEVQEDVPKKSSASSQGRDDADTKTRKVQEDVPKKSSASVVAGKSNVPSKASTVTGHQSLNYATKASTLGDGHSICVTNLPHDANCRQLVKRLKRFGPIKSVGIKTYFDNMSECCFADVEFESATSKENAIKESILEIGNHIAVIEEKRGTGLTQGDSNRSSSSPRNKLKKHGKDSRSKTSRKGLSRITPL